MTPGLSVRTLLYGWRRRGLYAKVISKLNDFFKVRRNIIFERAKFNCWDQAEGESAEQYITCLYNLVEMCVYGALKDDLLRDRIVVEVWDKLLSDSHTWEGQVSSLAERSHTKRGPGAAYMHKQQYSCQCWGYQTFREKAIWKGKLPTKKRWSQWFM